MKFGSYWDAVVFFYCNAGWSYADGEAPEVGHFRCAKELADVERDARSAGLTFRWVDDWSVGSHVEEFDTYEREPETCQTCLMFDPSGEVVGSLSCIDDATAAYRRVIEAEVAAEAML